MADKKVLLRARKKFDDRLTDIQRQRSRRNDKGSFLLINSLSATVNAVLVLNKYTN
jgi:hypothetical protein